MFSCYDKYAQGKFEECELCYQCCNYHNLTVKKKPQNLMGHHFRCKYPSPKVEDPSFCEESSPCIQSPPRKSARPSISTHRKQRPHGLVSNGSTSKEHYANDDSLPHKSACPSIRTSHKQSPCRQGSTLSNLKEHTANNECASSNCNLSAVEMDELQHALTVTRIAPIAIVHNEISPTDMNPMLLRSVNSLKEEVKAKDAELDKLKSQLNSLKAKVRKQLKQVHNTNHYHKRINDGSAKKETQQLIRKLRDTNIDSAEIVKGIIDTLMSNTYLRRSVLPALKDHLDAHPKFSAFFETKIIEGIRYKFRPWICLQQLDLCATVSFRAFDIIRKIEFCNDEKQRYRRGLLPSRFTLGRMCRQLEN